MTTTDINIKSKKAVEIRPGYKHTPLGWIPEDWVVTSLDYCSTINGEYGINAAAVDYSENLPTYIRITDIDNDGNFDHKGKKSVDDVNAGKYLVEAGDILFARTGATVGKTYLHTSNNGNLVFAGFLIRFRTNPDKLLPYYLKLFTSTQRYWDWVKVVSMRSGQPGINGTEYCLLPLLLPPLPQQTKIAAILSTWDETIQKTQALIAQLKVRNKGLAQQLLTGKKRLKGFENKDWTKLPADKIFKSVSVKNNGDEMLLSVTQDRGTIPRDMLESRVTMPDGSTNSYKLVDKGDFIISLRSFQGGLEYSEYRGIVSPAYTVLKPLKKISDSFYKHYFKSYDFIGHLAVAVIGIRDGKQISFDDFCILKLPYPDIAEQLAISAVLDKTKEELKTYQQYLASLQQQKKGLMQKLLTGAVRVKV